MEFKKYFRINEIVEMFNKATETETGELGEDLSIGVIVETEAGLCAKVTPEMFRYKSYKISYDMKEDVTVIKLTGVRLCIPGDNVYVGKVKIGFKKNEYYFIY